MNVPYKFPFYAKAALLLIGLYFLISMLSIAQSILLPLIFSAIIAMLISPGVNYLEKKKVNRTVSIAIVLGISIMVVAAIVVLTVSQASRFGNALPQLTDKFQELTFDCVTWASGYFNISALSINTWIENAKNDFINSSKGALGNTIARMGELMIATFLIPVYTFMLLFYRPHLREFIHRLFSADNKNKVSEILTETKVIIQSYLVGLFAETGIVAVMNSVGLLLLGIDYAILLGIAGALLNVIPYIGGIAGVLIFMVVALVTKPPIYVLYVFMLYVIIQFIDNNYIVPKIVGSKVKLNALVSIIAVILGAALWGIPGMFLSIPIIAIVKLILDRIEPLEPWGFLLADTSPISTKAKWNFSTIIEKIRPIFSVNKKKTAVDKEVFRETI